MSTPGPAMHSDPEPTGNPKADSERAPTPFDNPWLLPILLVGFALWFFYDGWFNPNIKAVMFNRIGAPLLALAAAWAVRGALRDQRLRREKAKPSGTGT